LKSSSEILFYVFFFFQAEDGIRDRNVTGVQTCALPISVYGELKTGYFEAIEIQVMINMLKIIDNPYQDIPLASVLRSPIVGLNEDQLAKIRILKPKSSYYEAIQEYKKLNKDDVTEKI